MKKKFIMLMIAFLMFIPLTIVKADITTDDVVSKIKERFEFESNSESLDVTYLGMQVTLTVTKDQTNPNKIRISTSTDAGGLLALAALGTIDTQGNTSLTTYIDYEYNNNVLSYNGSYGSNIETLMAEAYSGAEYDLLREAIQGYFGGYAEEINGEISKEVTVAAYQLKYPNVSDVDILNYLVNLGIVEKNNEQYTLHLVGGTNTKGIKVEAANDNITKYSINLNEIENPLGTTNNNYNNNTNTTADDKTEYNFIVGDYSISFEDHKDGDYTFRVDLFSTFHNPLSEQPVTSTNQEEKERFEKILNETKELTKENGEYIELYNISVFSPVSGYKTDGPFMLKMKITDKIKKYDTYELVNLICTETECEKGDVVKLKVEGDYLVGELPHLSQYVLVGKNTPNPGTGIAKYTIPGVALLLGTFGIYALYKKKIEV